ncbi:MAG: signal peptidase I [Actinobacteria bacterium]|nr:signal peptidase I [Actinomycetota bacterium]
MVLTILASVWQRFVVADRSMEPALVDGDRLLARRSRRPFIRGELVVIPHPRRADLWLVKRVIGLPGETITVDFGQVLVDGTSGLDRWGNGSTFPEGKWQIGKDQLFVLSDNRTATVDDSRMFGPVPVNRVFRPIWHRIETLRKG